MSYCVVDEISGVDGSRRALRTFEKFQDLKSWLVQNTGDLYQFIPKITQKTLPDFSVCKNVWDVNKVMEEYTYSHWRLKIITAFGLSDADFRKVYRRKSMMWLTVRPVKELDDTKYFDNGVSHAFLRELSVEECNVAMSAMVCRVVARTQYVRLVEWVGSKGTVKTWIPNRYMKKLHKKESERV